MSRWPNTYSAASSSEAGETGVPITTAVVVDSGRALDASGSTQVTVEASAVGLAAPTLTPPSGTPGPLHVTIMGPGSIYVSTDGSPPHSTPSFAYSGPIFVNGPLRIRAISVGPDNVTSKEATAVYSGSLWSSSCTWVMPGQSAYTMNYQTTASCYFSDGMSRWYTCDSSALSPALSSAMGCYAIQNSTVAGCLTSSECPF